MASTKSACSAETCAGGSATGAPSFRIWAFCASVKVAFVESIVILFSEHGWWYVVGAAVLAVLAYWFIGRHRSGVIYEVTWVAAASQLLAVLVPVLWELVKIVALIVLVALAVFLLAALLLDRK